MKLKAILSLQSLKKGLAYVIVMVGLLSVPMAAICQPGGPDGGGLPEAGVPFYDNMNLFFLAAGVLFAAFISIKYFRKKAATTV